MLFTKIWRSKGDEYQEVSCCSINECQGGHTPPDQTGQGSHPNKRPPASKFMIKSYMVVQVCLDTQIIVFAVSLDTL